MVLEIGGIPETHSWVSVDTTSLTVGLETDALTIGDYLFNLKCTLTFDDDSSFGTESTDQRIIVYDLITVPQDPIVYFIGLPE